MESDKFVEKYIIWYDSDQISQIIWAKYNAYDALVYFTYLHFKGYILEILFLRIKIF